MNMTQVWPIVAITVAIIGVLLRQMSLQRSELITKIDGVEAKLDARIDGLDAKIDGVESRLDAKLDGLRNELLAILKPMA